MTTFAQHERHTLVTHEQHVAGQVRSAYARAQVRMAPHVRAFVARYHAELQRRQHEAHAREMADSDDESEGESSAAAHRARVPSTWLTDRTPVSGGNVRALHTAVAGALAAFAAESATHLTAGRRVVRRAATEQARQALHRAPANATVWQPPDTDNDQDDDDDDQDDGGGADDRSTYNDTPLDRLTRHAADATAAGLLAVLLGALAAGATAAELAALIWQALGGALSWLLTICRTELALLWRAVTLAVWRADGRGAITGWIWRATGPNPCPFCLSMDGTKHALGDEMATHPNCYCTQEPIYANSESNDTSDETEE